MHYINWMYFTFKLSATSLLLLTVACQNAVWTPGRPNRTPVQFAPLPILHRNWQSSSASPSISKPPSSSELSRSAAFPFGGKLRVLSTLFGGLRNSGLESTIAGEVLQRLIKTTLRDLVVPFKKDFMPVLPQII